VVSGLARGVDSAAHAGALASGGRTIAVLGSGLDVVYPPENRDLAQRISRQGAVISEFPLHAPPLPAHFPHRNRIISGLCLGVLVVEATERSGSLITAQCALEQGREVFAVPGNLGAANSQGTNRLIKSGAKLVEGIQDILDELSPQIECTGRRQIIGQDRPPDLEPAEAALYDLLSDEPCHIDELIKQSLMTSAQVSGVLLQLELKGCVLHLSGQRYVRAVSLEKTLK
jgi:DNA processing protein